MGRQQDGGTTRGLNGADVVGVHVGALGRAAERDGRRQADQRTGGHGPLYDVPTMSLDSASSQRSAPAYSPTHTVQAIGRSWAVAAGHALASEAAARVLSAGGIAIDAGVAAGITLGVVHPDMVSVAGVAPILVHVAGTGQTFQVSGVGPVRATWTRMGATPAT